jgi:hypothetical protein
MKALELPKEVYKREDGRWCKPCPSCGELQSYLRRNYAIESYKLQKVCKKCSNRKTENCHRGFVGHIRVSWFNKFKTQAELRNHTFAITIEDVLKLYTMQQHKCSLSGMPIGWASVGNDHSASIDRIDSTKGYTVNNIQLVHKDINMMKQQFSNDYFILMCMAVADENS